MNTQMHSLREETKILRNYKQFHGEKERLGLTEAIGALVLAFCVGYTVFSFAIG